MLSILMTTEYTPAADNAALKQLLSGVAAGDIGYAKAKSIALNHAGVSESAAYDMEVEPDNEDGVPVYEVSFKSGDMEYEYDIHAATGEILKHEAEQDD